MTGDEQLHSASIQFIWICRVFVPFSALSVIPVTVRFSPSSIPLLPWNHNNQRHTSTRTSGMFVLSLATLRSLLVDFTATFCVAVVRPIDNQMYVLRTQLINSQHSNRPQKAAIPLAIQVWMCGVCVCVCYVKFERKVCESHLCVLMCSSHWNRYRSNELDTQKTELRNKGARTHTQTHTHASHRPSPISSRGGFSCFTNNADA